MERGWICKIISLVYSSYCFNIFKKYFLTMWCWNWTSGYFFNAVSSTYKLSSHWVGWVSRWFSLTSHPDFGTSRSTHLVRLVEPRHRPRSPGPVSARPAARRRRVWRGGRGAAEGGPGVVGARVQRRGPGKSPSVAEVSWIETGDEDHGVPVP